MKEDTFKALCTVLQKQGSLQLQLIGALIEVGKCLPTSSRGPVWKNIEELLELNKEEAEARETFLNAVLEEIRNG